MINEQLDGQLRMATLDPLKGQQFQVRKRDGRVIDFDETRIYLAIEAALKADAELEYDAKAPEDMQADAQRLANEVVEKCISRAVKGEALEIE
ncbi:MAG: ATP cone domain-containing protein, partial [Verrucomicrobiota bacterium]|nr:ATP cone domain-containing protein [Verrucomicrobiota bacterium]